MDDHDKQIEARKKKHEIDKLLAQVSGIHESQVEREFDPMFRQIIKKWQEASKKLEGK